MNLFRKKMTDFRSAIFTQLINQQFMGGRISFVYFFYSFMIVVCTNHMPTLLTVNFIS